MSQKKRRKLSEGTAGLAGAIVLKAGAPHADGANEGEMDRAAWQLFADEYHDIVEQLPLELKRSLLLVSELEHHMQSSQEKLHTALIKYISQRRDFAAHAKRRKSIIREEETPESTDDPASLFSARDRRNTPPPPSPRTQIRSLASEIAKDSRIGIRAGEDKVQQANAMYDTVDRHIRRLDADLAKYEDSLVIGLRAGTLPSSEAPSLFAAAAYTNASTSVGARGGQERPSAAITAAASVADDHTRGVRVDPKAPPMPSSPATPQEKVEKSTGRGRKKVTAEKEPSEDEEEEGSVIVGDPDDRLYCHCKRISFGDMIACDNEDCPTEWYHYECIGLKEAPRGRWYCRDCVQAHGVQARKTRR